MTRGIRITVWVVGLTTAAVAATYLNETTVRRIAADEARSALNCALSASLYSFVEAEAAKQQLLEALRTYCLSTRRVRIRLEHSEVTLKDTYASPTQVQREMTGMVRYTTGEVIPSRGNEVTMVLTSGGNPQVGQLNIIPNPSPTSPTSP